MSWPDHVVNGTTFQSAKNQFSNMESLPCDRSPTLRISLVRESDLGGGGGADVGAGSGLS
jgi:hypothetical protein